MVHVDWMELLEDSVVVQDWIQRGMMKGIQKGFRQGLEKGRRAVMEARRSDLLAVLRSRFGRVGRKLHVLIQGTEDAGILRKLIEKAAVARSLEQFSQALPVGGDDCKET